jgi:nitrate/nitrite transporter NarK
MSGLPKQVLASCSVLRRISPIPWIAGLVFLLWTSEEDRIWSGPTAFFACFISVCMGLGGLVAILFSENEAGEKVRDPVGVVLGIVGVLGAFGAAFVSMVLSPGV